MRIGVNKASEVISGSTHHARIGARAASRQAPGSAMPRLTPPADLVAMQQIMQRGARGRPATADPDPFW